MLAFSSLEMKGIRKAFPGVVALDGVDLELSAGEVHVLLGENGAGKSTLVKILSGAVRRDRGEIRLDGRTAEIRSPADAQRLGIRVIHQELNLVPQLSAAENILLGEEPTRGWGIVHRRGLQETAEGRLRSLGARFSAGARVADLSLAQRQLVEVAKALTASLRILVMDEPTSALAAGEIDELFAVIRDLKTRGVAILYISHRLEELFEIGDRVTVLRDGRLAANADVADVDETRLIRWMADRELTDHYPKDVCTRADELLRLEEWRTDSGAPRIDLQLHRGEVVGLAGMVGAGRTRLAASLFGFPPAASGRLLIRGREKRIRTPLDAIRAGIGYLPEDRKGSALLLSRSVRENIGLASLDRLARWGVLDGRRERTMADSFIQDLRIKCSSREQRVSSLSGGNQQKTALSRWLARRVDILICDEPTRGIDVAAKVEIYQLMNRLTERGVGILLISSDLPEVLGMSDRILVMRQGEIAAAFGREDADQESVLKAAIG